MGILLANGNSVKLIDDLNICDGVSVLLSCNLLKAIVIVIVTDFLAFVFDNT